MGGRKEVRGGREVGRGGSRREGGGGKREGRLLRWERGGGREVGGR